MALFKAVLISITDVDKPLSIETFLKAGKRSNKCFDIWN